MKIPGEVHHPDLAKKKIEHLGKFEFRVNSEYIFSGKYVPHHIYAIKISLSILYLCGSANRDEIFQSFHRMTFQFFLLPLKTSNFHHLLPCHYPDVSVNK